MGRARVFMAVMAWALSALPAAAYSHYNHFTAQGLIQEKFDLNALPNRTLTFFVSGDTGSVQYGPNDSFPSALSQIRQATAAWNAVDTSDLRVAFGGQITAGTPQSTPSGLVTFEDIGPGVLAYTTHTVGDAGPNATFVPVTQGVVHLNRNLTVQPGPSYMESFFTTVVHEMGHVLGLQHTYTSSAMSTAITRATTRMKPIDADDVAAISLLYPNAKFAGTFGSIAGRVTSGGQPLNMASVVALPPAGPAISALTHPDGTYRIDGVPAGRYWIYVHPLPPNPDFQYPTDASGRPVAPSGPFETLFYQRGTAGTREPLQFSTIDVVRGGTVSGIDFAPQPRSSWGIYDVTTYSYIGSNAVSPAYLNPVNAPGTVMALGAGLLNGGRTATGLSAQILGGFANMYAMQPWQNGLVMYLTYPPFAGTGPRHILFNLPNDAYVLPAGVTLVQKQPPTVAAVTPNGDGTAAITGSNMSADSRVYFDGIPAAVRSAFTGTDQSGTIVVTAPQGANNQVSTITVYNADGQNSMATQSQGQGSMATQSLNQPVYSYGPADPVFATITPSSLPAGTTSMVQVDGVNTKFIDGQTTLGFGSSDVFVRRVWVVSPTRLLANVAVSPNAAAGTMSMVNVISGFQSFAQPFGFQVQPANPQQPSIALPLANAAPNQSGIYPGAAVSVYGTNLATSPTGTTVTVNDQPARVLYASAGQVNFTVPAGTTLGPAVVRLNNGSDNANPVVMQVDPAPPVLASILSSSNATIDSFRPAGAGDILNVTVGNIDASVAGSPSRLRVNVGGTEVAALVVVPVQGQSNLFLAQIILPQVGSGAQVPVTVSVDGGNSSNPLYIAIR